MKIAIYGVVLFWCGGVWAGTLYKCTQAGAVTYQDAPCANAQIIKPLPPPDPVEVKERLAREAHAKQAEKLEKRAISQAQMDAARHRLIEATGGMGVNESYRRLQVAKCIELEKMARLSGERRLRDSYRIECAGF